MSMDRSSSLAVAGDKRENAVVPPPSANPIKGASQVSHSKGNTIEHNTKTDATHTIITDHLKPYDAQHLHVYSPGVPIRVTAFSDGIVNGEIDDVDDTKLFAVAGDTWLNVVAPPPPGAVSVFRGLAVNKDKDESPQPPAVASTAKWLLEVRLAGFLVLDPEFPEVITSLGA